MSPRGNEELERGIQQGTIRVQLCDIVVEERIRKDYGNIDELANSIKEVGLIQPVILRHDLRLLVGGRRLEALKRLGIKELIHGCQFIWTEELDKEKLQASEIEENLKRKALSWQEEILAKKRLLGLMQSMHGVARSGFPSRSDVLGITSPGFGINKLASLLGESNAQTSKDIELAGLIEAIPELGRAETKEAARRQAVLGTAVAVAIAQAKLKPQQAASQLPWTLFEEDFDTEEIDPQSVDLVITDPPYGNEQEGMGGANSRKLLTDRFDDSFKNTERLLFRLALHSFKVLKPDRFAVFFFDFVLYTSFVHSLQSVGFVVDSNPVIWVKNTVINTSPYTRYGRSYEPILICRKGEPKLMRVLAQRDVVEIPNVITCGTQEQKFFQAQKPVALIEKFILDMTPPESIVVDFCSGSGTTGVAALQQKRRVILFEKDHGACQIIKTRLQAI